MPWHYLCKILLVSYKIFSWLLRSTRKSNTDMKVIIFFFLRTETIDFDVAQVIVPVVTISCFFLYNHTFCSMSLVFFSKQLVKSFEHRLGFYFYQLTSLPKEEQQAHRQDSNINNHASPSNPLPPPPLQANSITNFSGVPSIPIRTVNPSVLPLQIENPMMESQSLGQGHQFINHSTNLVRPVAVVPAVCTPAMPDLNLNLKPTADSSSLSLKLSSPFVQRESTSRSSAFQAMSSMKNGDNTITVAWGRITREGWFIINQKK